MNIRTHRHLIDTVGRFLVSGSVGAGSNIGILYVLTEYVRLYYLLSACISFVLAAGIGFMLQKFWTFRDHSIERMHVQAAGFFAVTTINFFINIALLYALVQWVHVWYVLAQAIASILIAFGSFILYRHVVFARRVAPHRESDMLCSQEAVHTVSVRP